MLSFFKGKCSLGFKKIYFLPFKLLSFFWSFGSVRNKMSFWWQDRPSRELSWSELNWKRNCLLMTSFHDCIFLLFSSDNCFYIFIFKVDSFFSMYGVVKKQQQISLPGDFSLASYFASLAVVVALGGHLNTKQSHTFYELNSNTSSFTQNQNYV